jgi:hypothetical protein
MELVFLCAILAILSQDKSGNIDNTIYRKNASVEIAQTRDVIIVDDKIIVLTDHSIKAFSFPGLTVIDEYRLPYHAVRLCNKASTLYVLSDHSTIFEHRLDTLKQINKYDIFPFGCLLVYDERHDRFISSGGVYKGLLAKDPVCELRSYETLERQRKSALNLNDVFVISMSNGLTPGTVITTSGYVSNAPVECKTSIRQADDLHEVASFHGHTKMVTSAADSPSRLLSGDAGGFINLYSKGDSKLLFSTQIANSMINHICYVGGDSFVLCSGMLKEDPITRKSLLVDSKVTLFNSVTTSAKTIAASVDDRYVKCICTHGKYLIVLGSKGINIFVR